MPVIEECTTTIHVSVVQLRRGVEAGVIEAIKQKIHGIALKIKVAEENEKWYVTISYRYGPSRVTWFTDEVNKIFIDERQWFSRRVANKPDIPLKAFDFDLNWCRESDTLEDVRQSRKRAEEEVKKGLWPGWAGRPTGPYQFPPEAFDDPDEINREFPTYWPGYAKSKKENADCCETSETSDA